MRAFFFDRDGVVNELVNPDLDRGPRTFSEFKFVSGIHEVVMKLSEVGFHCEIISNQPDFSRGLLIKDEHLKIKQFISREIPQFKRQRYCLHDNKDNCLCRKPKTGLLDDSVKEFSIEIESSFFVGDKWTDILAAKKFGCKSILLRNDSSWLPTSQGSPPQDLLPDFVITSVSEVIEIPN